MATDGTTGDLFDDATDTPTENGEPTSDDDHSANGAPESASSNDDSPSDRADTETDGDADEGDVATIEEGKILDYITGESVTERSKEIVRQKTARALVHELGIRPEDMETDLRITLEIDGKSTWRQLEIGIWNPDDEHENDKIKRVVVCEDEPSSNGTNKIRTHEQAEEDLKQLKAFMAALPECKYGMWTNGLDIFYLKKKETRFDTQFEQIGDWPPAADSLELQDARSRARLRAADPDMLKTTFRRCHNFIHGNEGMQKEEAFWQFLYLIFAKMYDEETHKRENRQFWAGATEQFTEDGKENIRSRVEPLFNQAKTAYSEVFEGGERLRLSPRALAFMVSELSRYDFTRTNLDAKGAAYQEIVGSNLRGDKGQYFTPRGVVDMAVDMLDPKTDERLIDPACGTGGFMVSTLSHLFSKLREERGVEPHDEASEAFYDIKGILEDYAETNLFGIEHAPQLVKATTMNIAMATGASGNVYYANSLEFPNGHLDGVEKIKRDIPLGSADVLITNPPFGSEIPVNDRDILKRYDLARKWERGEDGILRNTGELESSVAPEILFLEQCIRWLKPGGRMAIVLPNAMLNGPSNEYLRRWLLDRCWVLASVEVPIEAFIHEADVSIHTSVLFLKKKSDEERQLEALGGDESYPIFMAVAESCGYDRRGNPVYKRSPTGEAIVQEIKKTEKIRIGDEEITRELHRKEKVVDDDLPDVAAAYHEFREENPEPGL
jgi:type I restriction enzyme M protein